MSRTALLVVLAVTSSSWAAGKKDWAAVVADRSAAKTERIKAAKALATSKEAGAIDALLAALDSSYEGFSEVLVEALKAQKAGAVLIKRLEDSTSSEETKQRACTGLRVLHEPAAVKPLAAALKDSSPKVRKDAAWALSVVGPAGAEDALVAALKDDDKDVRYFVADALGSVRTDKAKQAVEAQLKVETDGTVKYALTTAQRRLEAPLPK